MRIQLSDHFTYGRILRYVYPTILMMIFTSIYSVVDGFFVSNFVGKVPFAAVNLVFPLLTILSTLGFMIGTGGSAVVGITLGEGDKPRANRYFSLFIYSLLVIGVVTAAVCEVFIEPLVGILGADAQTRPDCITYARINLLSLPFFMLQVAFQTYFTTAEKPRLGMYMTVLAGCTNMVLDALFIAVFHWGIAGAAAATTISEFVGGGVPLIYFARQNDSLLRLTRTVLDLPVLLRACGNGASEMVNSISGSLVTILYNHQLIRFAGADGVAAYGVVMYVNFIFLSIFLGFVFGSAPITSFHHGAGNHDELKNLFRISTRLIGVFAICMFLLSQAAAGPLTRIFVGYDPGLQSMTEHGFRIFSVTFLISGYNIYSSSLFTSLGDGKTSALLSTLRTLVYQVAAILILPHFLGLEGIWLAVILFEAAALITAAVLIFRKRNIYHYL